MFITITTFGNYDKDGNLVNTYKEFTGGAILELQHQYNKMNKYFYILLILFFLTSCISSKYSIRPIGDEHVIRNQGIIASRGIYVTNDTNSSLDILVNSFEMRIYRDHKLIFKEISKNKFYTKNMMLFLNEKFQCNDFIIIDNVLITENNKKKKVKKISFLNKNC